MPPDADGFADMVVLTIKSALAPLLERLASAEARLTAMQGATETIATLRDRVVTVETKAPPAAGIDFAPVLERLAVAEARLATLGDLRDRVMETKAAQPLIPDLAISELRERVASVESKSGVPTAADLLLSDLKQRLGVLESRIVPPSVSPEDVTAIRDRLVAVETKAAQPTAAAIALADVKQRVEAVHAVLVAVDSKCMEAVSDLRERVAVVEVRAQVPGPAGQAGKDGQDGADGLGFEDLVAVQQDDRSFTVKAMRGERVKEIGTARFPVQIQRGVYIDGKAYEQGDVVTWAGSQWHCNEATETKPGDGLKAWTLIVKRGRDGKDGRDAPGALPVVSVGRPT